MCLQGISLQERSFYLIGLGSLDQTVDFEAMYVIMMLCIFELFSEGASSLEAV